LSSIIYNISKTPETGVLASTVLNTYQYNPVQVRCSVCRWHR